MKRLLFAPALLPIIISSCSPTLFTFKTQPKRNEIVITPEMKSFTAANKNPTVVLRVPSAASSVTEQESQSLSVRNDIYNRIEKNLLKAGFTVRDRALLNNLMSTGQVSYSEIAKKIETDVMIEILGIDFLDNFSNIAVNKRTGREVLLPEKTLDAQTFKLECKLTLVNKGSTGALLTFNKTKCENGCDFVYLNAKNNGYRMRFDKSNAIYVQWYNKLSWGFDQDKDAINAAVDEFSNSIINILRGNTQ